MRSSCREGCHGPARAAKLTMPSEATRLGALQSALERAADERRAASACLAEAADALRHARAFGRKNLALAYAFQQQTSELSPAAAEAERNVRADVLAHSEDVERALEEEISATEPRVDYRRRERYQALGMLVSRSPEVIHLLRRIA